MTTIYLSPSMQEHNIGKGDYGTEEKRMNQLADIVEQRLKACGYIVYRNTTSMTLEQIVKDSNNRKPDIHLALHSNAFNGKARGCEIWIHKKGGNGEIIAKNIYKYLEPLTPTTDRGIKEGYNRFGNNVPLYELAYTDAPAVLIEVDFHDNEESAQWILNNLNNIADSIVLGINESTGVRPVVVGDDETDWKAEYYKLLGDIKALADLYV